MNCANHPAVAEGIYPCTRCSRPYCTDCLVTMQGRRYCASCKNEQLTDIRSGVDSTQLQLAGIGRRFAASWVDGIVIGLPLAFFLIPAMMSAGGGEAPDSMSWAVYLTTPLYLIYEALMMKARGQTLGKMALGIKVVQMSGQPLSTGQAWGRAFIRAIFFSFLGLINYGAALFTKEKTCIHDMAAKTRVVLAR